jgi:glycosyltransferase involved in cell wall biosynthesis
MAEIIKGMISILIPTYNEREDLLRQSIESALNQTYPNIEVIVIDDGSTDNTPNILKGYGKDIVTVRRERESGLRSVSQAVNLGFEKSRGAWIHNDAADCYLEPNWAQEVMEFIAGREDTVNGVHTDFATHYVLENKIERYRVRDIYDFSKSTFENYKGKESLGGWLFKRENWIKAGPWDDRFPRKQTREFFLRILRLGDLVYLPRELWHFIYHEADQWKTKASVKYRILGDLKNGWDIIGNTRWGLSRPETVDAVVEAYRAFFEDPEWEPERTSGPWRKRLEQIRQQTDTEASEPWKGVTDGVDRSK